MDIEPRAPGAEEFDAIVIGTGFGGAIVACRLVQAGYRICVLERGRRYEGESFPQPPSLNPLQGLGGWLWQHDGGLYDLRDLDGAQVVTAAGYGGGSLVYANVHLRAPPEALEKWPVNRAVLNPYYDLAAYMLDVKPMPPTLQPKKTHALKMAAESLGRKGQLIDPPLAVWFENQSKPEVSRSSDARRQPCNQCGACVMGCRRGSKNTLNFNYLAEVDAHPERASVRTRAEVQRIRQSEDRFVVTYADHLVNGRETHILGRYVFLCAGAVNSTELLLRAKEREDLNLTSEHLGGGFHVNGDALGLVFDTKDAVSPNVGPTISTALVYQRATEKESDEDGWFMIQDSGFPAWTAPYLGMMRSPLWLRSNARGHGTGQGAPIFPRPPRPPRPPAPPEASYTDRGARLTTNFIDNLTGLDTARTGPSRRAGASDHVFPEDMVNATRKFELQATELLRQEARTIIKKVVDDPGLADALADASMTQFLGRFGIRSSDNPLFRWLKKIGAKVARWLLPQGDQMASQILPITQTVVQAHLDARLEALLPWLLQRDAVTDHSAMFLMMGRDNLPGRLLLERDDRDPARPVQAIRLQFPQGPGAPLYSRGERIMADLAQAMGGELRLNPAWTWLRRPITVHPQGGCSMSEDPAKGVTKPSGELHDVRNFFVVDGSLFPSAVGVNPSATIAALAERCAELFIRRSMPDWRAPETEAAQKWALQHAASLDPLATIQSPSPPPATPPVSLEFSEIMRGFVSWEAPESFEDAERVGRQQGQVLELELKAKIRDLRRFIDDPEHVVNLTGLVYLAGEKPFEVQGTMNLLLMSQRTERKMVYTLSSNDGRFSLRGLKTIFDDPGLDALQDVTRLDIEGELERQRMRGVCRLRLNDFFYVQLPSFRAQGLASEDNAALMWTAMRFLTFFFGHLAGVYLPDPTRHLRSGRRTLLGPDLDHKAAQ